ncbi:hypothetical protein J6E39_09195 [bacterium]|nr:hypothetical protein [bacterium]
MKNISFAASMHINDLNADNAKNKKYQQVSQKFQEITRLNDNNTVEFTHFGDEISFDKFEVIDKKNNIRDTILIKGFENFDEIPKSKLLNKFLDIYKVSKMRLNYDKLIKEKDEKISQLYMEKQKLIKCKRNASRLNMPTDIEYREFYTYV